MHDVLSSLMGRNPKESKWRSTPEALRKRKSINLTLSPEALQQLDDLAGPGGRSALVERLISEFYEASKKTT